MEWKQNLTIKELAALSGYNRETVRTKLKLGGVERIGDPRGKRGSPYEFDRETALAVLKCSAVAQLPTVRPYECEGGGIWLRGVLVEPGDVISYRRDGESRQGVVFSVHEAGWLEVVPEPGMRWAVCAIDSSWVDGVFHSHRFERGCCAFDARWHTR